MQTLTKWYVQAKCALAKEDGIGTVEMILILFVLIGVVIIFKNNIEALVKEYFAKMDPGFTHDPVK